MTAPALARPVHAGMTSPIVRKRRSATAATHVVELQPPGGSAGLDEVAGAGALRAPAPATDPVIDPGALRSWELIQAAQGGDRDAVATLYERYRDKVFRVVYSRVGHRQLAEDLTGDTFVRALAGLDRFAWRGRDVGAWLTTIARNLVADHYKSGQYRYEVTRPDVLDADRAGPEDPESAAADYLRNRVLLAALAQLGAAQRRVLVLRYLLGLSVAETAIEMRKPQSAIKALAYRATRALAAELPEGFTC